VTWSYFVSERWGSTQALEHVTNLKLTDSPAEDSYEQDAAATDDDDDGKDALKCF
jgi:hypothetical protein